VVDEYGGVAGVITIKDLLEPLVGDLQDEFDSDDEPEIVRVDNQRWLVDGRASVDDVVERLGIEIPDGEYVTLGGYLFDAFGHIPEEGERVPSAAGDWELRVVEMDKRRIARVVAKRLASEKAPHPAEGAAGGASKQPSRNGAEAGQGLDGESRSGQANSRPGVV
jgi:putative hemolysin